MQAIGRFKVSFAKGLCILQSLQFQDAWSFVMRSRHQCREFNV